MKQMVLMVLDNPDYCMNLLEAWEAAGAPGITILESTGLIRMRQAAARDDLPLMPTLSTILSGKEEHHRTIFTIVESEEQAQEIIAVTEKAFEKFETNKRDESGVLFVLPVSSSQSFSTSKARKRVAKNRED
ncbi:hypothetical protein ACFLYO_05290 [Chloroflexota bacterium]